MQAHDLIAQQNDRKAHTSPFVLWPRAWQGYSSIHCSNWTVTRLAAASHPAIPRRPGIYTMLVQPGIAQHPAASFLLYVGQAKDLYARFSDYLTSERRPEGRPRIIRLLHMYDAYLWFCYCEVPRADLDVAENALITAYDPPCNERTEAQLSKKRKAF